MPTLIDDTIAAIATPMGKSGIGLIRLSGGDARRIAEAVCGCGDSGLRDRTTRLRRIRRPQTGEVLDEAMVTYFQAPRSFTTEDVVEIGCHGSPVVLQAVMAVLLESGARMATPGEFTLRAFLRGRIDLVQAEAIRDLIEAKTLFQARVARRQAEGSLSRRLKPIKELLVRLISLLEAGIDFADDDVPVPAAEEIQEHLQPVVGGLQALEAGFGRGRLLSAGLTVAVVGRVNVGKSSLFNTLLNQERAIVNECPGTTRDVVAEEAQLGGIPVRWLDTAGIRNAKDPVERIGIDKTREALADADRLLLVLDGSADLTEEDRRLLEELKQQACCLVVNKIDLPQRLPGDGMEAIDAPVVRVSALTGEGVERLKQVLLQNLGQGKALEQEGSLVTSLRQQERIGEASRALKRAAGAVEQGLPHELILLDLHGALNSLNELTGETGIEDILGRIFQTFCVGK